MNKYADFAQSKPITTALALALGAGIALGLTRFSYALFLPLMREDLGWTYLIAGGMNTANAGGYFLGAILSPWFLKRFGVANVFIGSAIFTSVLMGISGNLTDTLAFFLARFFAGSGSAFTFVTGGVLAAQLGVLHTSRSGLLLGIYYGGSGSGIVISSFLVPLSVFLAQRLGHEHDWQLGWWILGFVGVLMALVMAKPSLSIPVHVPSSNASKETTPITRYAYMILGYFCFGMGYIGYMTFIIALLRQMGVQGYSLNIFYAVLGLCVMGSSRVWAPMLDRFKEGQSLAILNTLLAVSSLIPVIMALFISDEQSLSIPLMIAIYISGIVFGGSFLSAVASTTAFVKHNLPQGQWVSGITVFTTVFAIGQVSGPMLVGWVSDGSGGLARGLFISGLILLFGAGLASRQKPLRSSS